MKLKGQVLYVLYVYAEELIRGLGAGGSGGQVVLNGGRHWRYYCRTGRKSQGDAVTGRQHRLM